MKSNKPYSRVERVNKQILDILSGVLTKNVDLSFLGFVTFTNVDIAPDFKSAKIYYSILNPKLSNDQVNIEINKKYDRKMRRCIILLGLVFEQRIEGCQ